MYVQNISFQIAPTLETQWLEWMKAKLIPLFSATGCFNESKFYQLEVTTDQAPTYTLQLFTSDQGLLNNYLEQHADKLLQEIQAIWGDQCFHFSTTMKIVN